MGGEERAEGIEKREGGTLHSFLSDKFYVVELEINLNIMNSSYSYW